MFTVIAIAIVKTIHTIDSQRINYTYCMRISFRDFNTAHGAVDMEKRNLRDLSINIRTIGSTVSARLFETLSLSTISTFLKSVAVLLDLLYTVLLEERSIEYLVLNAAQKNTCCHFSIA